MSLTNPESFESPKKRFAEKWKRKRSLAAGGQGEIFLVQCVDSEQEGLFVQKRLKNANSIERRERFLREIETTAKLEHPNILKIFDSSVNESPPYYISEYCEGGDLSKRAAQYRGDIGAVVRDVL